MPRISVVIPNYNYGRYIGEAIDHVVRQTFTDWELIVVDDHSTDNSRQIVEARIRQYPDKRIRLIHHENGPSGTPTPINIGIRHMRGDYFAWLSSDDVFEPDKLETQLDVLETRPNVALAHSAYVTIDEMGLETGSFYPPADFDTDAFTGLLEGNFINGNTVLIRRKVLEKIGPFLETDPECPDLWRAAEYLHWLKIAAKHSIACIEHPLHRSRRHSGNAEYNSSSMGSALERMLIRKFFSTNTVEPTPERIAALMGRGLMTLAVTLFSQLSISDRSRAFHLLRRAELDQEKWDVGYYNGVERIDSGRIRQAFHQTNPSRARSMLRAVAALRRAQVKPYKSAAIRRLAQLESLENVPCRA